jgi:hypothetical protein
MAFRLQRPHFRKREWTGMAVAHPIVILPFMIR